ncbi:hypothetical protein KM043_001735 [Ampulex compressa]|nr:hypothetical protein KM043_001735 [Ampulex compressa]
MGSWREGPLALGVGRSNERGSPALRCARKWVDASALSPAEWIEREAARPRVRNVVGFGPQGSLRRSPRSRSLYAQTWTTFAMRVGRPSDEAPRKGALPNSEPPRRDALADLRAILTPSRTALRRSEGAFATSRSKNGAATISEGREEDAFRGTASERAESRAGRDRRRGVARQCSPDDARRKIPRN